MDLHTTLLCRVTRDGDPYVFVEIEAVSSRFSLHRFFAVEMTLMLLWRTRSVPAMRRSLGNSR
jgi:hypothetical protein